MYDCLRSSLHTHLVKHAAGITFYCTRGQKKPARNLFVGTALSHQSQQLKFPLAQQAVVFDFRLLTFHFRLNRSSCYQCSRGKRAEITVYIQNALRQGNDRCDQLGTICILRRVCCAK